MLIKPSRVGTMTLLGLSSESGRSTLSSNSN